MKNVLIVEDYEDTRKLIEYYAASQSELHVTLCANGLDALSFISDAANRLDGVVIDLAMYPMDGISLAEKIRLLEQTELRGLRLKLAFFTAQIVDEVIRTVIREIKAREEVFRKPCEPAQLFAEIKLWLEEN